MSVNPKMTVLLTSCHHMAKRGKTHKRQEVSTRLRRSGFSQSHACHIQPWRISVDNGSSALNRVCVVEQSPGQFHALMSSSSAGSPQQVPRCLCCQNWAGHRLRGLALMRTVTFSRCPVRVICKSVSARAVVACVQHKVKHYSALFKTWNNTGEMLHSGTSAAPNLGIQKVVIQWKTHPTNF